MTWPLSAARRARQCVPLSVPSHVVVGKVPARLHKGNPQLEKKREDAQADIDCAIDTLPPGSKVVVLDRAGIVAEVLVLVSHGTTLLQERRGWVYAGCLQALPPPKVVGTCKSCRQSLPASAFSKGQLRVIRQGIPAECEDCKMCLSWRRVASALLDGACWLNTPMRAGSVGGLLAIVFAIITGPSQDVGGRLVWEECVQATIVLGLFLASLWLLWCGCWRRLYLYSTRSCEATLHEQPLSLIGRSGDGQPCKEGTPACTSAQPWQSLVTDERLRSFASYLQCPFKETTLSMWFSQALEGTPWERPEVRTGHVLPRQAAWFVRSGCACSYQYHGTSWPAVEMPAWLLAIEDEVWEMIAAAGGTPWPRPNSCVANLYQDGSESVDWHADNEPLFEGRLKDCCIVSLSLGATRRFELRRRTHQGSANQQQNVSVELKAGDLVTMEGLFQKHWLHRVPRERELSGSSVDGDLRRINLTWRTITAHSAVDACPLASSSASGSMLFDGIWGFVKPLMDVTEKLRKLAFG